MLTIEKLEFSRKLPRQKRSINTVAIILEAAAQVLHTKGEKAFSTKSVAERAGVSIGTLYQYFSNIDAILVALADLRRQRVSLQTRALLGRRDYSCSLEAPCALIQIFIDYYVHRAQMPRQSALIDELKKERRITPLDSEFVELMSACWSETQPGDSRMAMRLHAQVLLRALRGVLYVTMLEDESLLSSSALKDALLKIVIALEPAGFRMQSEAATRP